MSKLLGTILTITVAIICIATILVPTISDATKTEKIFENTGIYFDTDNAVSHTLEYADGVLTVDGGTVTLPTEGQTPIVIADGFNMIYKNNANFVVVIDGIITCTSANFAIEDGTISGTITYSSTTASKTATYTNIAVAVPTQTTQTFTYMPYVNDGDTISSTGVMTFNDSGGNQHPLQWSFEGIIGGNCTVTTLSGVASQYSFSNIEINYSEINGYEDLYRVESISFDVDYTNPNNSSVTSNFTVTSMNVIAPESTTAELTDHLTSSQIAILAVIPLLMIVSVLIIVANRLRYND